MKTLFIFLFSAVSAVAFDTNVVNVVVTNYVTVETPKQQSNYVAKGKYEQVLQKEIATPDAGVMKVAVTEYVGPLGKGYEYIYAFTDKAGTNWIRSMNVGPIREDYRNSNWVIQPSNALPK